MSEEAENVNVGTQPEVGTRPVQGDRPEDFRRLELWDIKDKAEWFGSNPLINDGLRRAYLDLAYAANVLDAFLARLEGGPGSEYMTLDEARAILGEEADNPAGPEPGAAVSEASATMDTEVKRGS